MRIVSYFSLPTDLAAAMSDWPEFVSGIGYDVDLRDAVTGEAVSVRFIENKDEFDHIQISTNVSGRLYEKVVGRTIIELLPHTDNLMVHRDY